MMTGNGATHGLPFTISGYVNHPLTLGNDSDHKKYLCSMECLIHANTDSTYNKCTMSKQELYSFNGLVNRYFKIRRNKKWQ